MGIVSGADASRMPVRAPPPKFSGLVAPKRWLINNCECHANFSGVPSSHQVSAVERDNVGLTALKIGEICLQTWTPTVCVDARVPKGRWVTPALRVDHNDSGYVD